MRERLIELILDTEAFTADFEEFARQQAEYKAGYLLANGVIALPELKHRQTVYQIYKNKIMQLEVASYAIRPEFDNLLQIHLYKNGFNGCCTMDDFGKTVFLTKEEAEAALRKEGAE